MDMKYLKRFENIFGGVSEPELFYDRDLPRSSKNNPFMYNNYTSNRESWTDKEIDIMESMVKSSDKVEGFNYTLIDDNPEFKVFHFDLFPEGDANDNKEIYCHKCQDEVYLVQEFVFELVDRRYFCDGFECFRRKISQYL